MTLKYLHFLSRLIPRTLSLNKPLLNYPVPQQSFNQQVQSPLDGTRLSQTWLLHTRYHTGSLLLKHLLKSIKVLIVYFYRSSDNPSAQWITHNVPASQNPQYVIRNLMPGTQYNIQITPIR